MDDIVNPLGTVSITIDTSGFVDFTATYYDDGHLATFVGVKPDGSTVYETWSDSFPYAALTFRTVPPPEKPVATSTAGTQNTSPVLYQAIGQPIPIIWGNIRVQGAQLWSSNAYAGGGIGNVVDVAVGWGTPLETNGQLIADLTTARLWGNSNLFYDVDSGGSSVGAFQSTQYYGFENQQPDPTLVNYLGAAGTPAFRGLNYTVFQALPLAPFNNAVSSVTFSNQLRFGARWRLTSVLEYLAQRGGYSPSAFAMTNIDDSMDGGQITSSTDFLTLLQGLATIYNFLILEHPLRLKRIAVGSGLVINKTIPESECVSTSDSDDVVLVTDAEPWTIPNQISLSYISAALDYTVATVPVKRPIFPFGLTGPLRVQTYSLPFVVTDDEAANLAWLYLYRLWIQAKTITFTALPKHLDVEPGDVIRITSQGITYTAFVTRSTIRPDFANAIIATALLTNTDIDLNAHPGPLPLPLLICPVTDWTTLDPNDIAAPGGTAVGTKVTNCGLLATSMQPDGGARSLSFRTSGRYFFQVRIAVAVPGIYGAAIGVAEAGASFASPNGLKQGFGSAVVQTSGTIFANGVAQSYDLGSPALDDVFSFAVDLDIWEIWMKLNSGAWNGNGLADPATGAYGVSMSTLIGQPLAPVISFAGFVSTWGGSAFSINCGQSPFVDRNGTPVPVPAGFTHGWPI